jgi:hypothetical protein
VGFICPTEEVQILPAQLTSHSSNGKDARFSTGKYGFDSRMGHSRGIRLMVKRLVANQETRVCCTRKQLRRERQVRQSFGGHLPSSLLCLLSSSLFRASYPALSCPIRLTARIPGSQPVNTGSIPVWDTARSLGRHAGLITQTE